MTSSTGTQPKRFSVRRSLFISLAQKYTGLVISLPTLMITSRLLTPAQIGIFSVAMAVTSLIQTLKNFGVSDFIVQDTGAERESVKTAFTISIIISWSLGALLFLTSPAIARFYEAPAAKPVLQTLSGLFVLLPYTSIVFAMLTRDMAFGALYKITTVENLARSGCTIALASLGFGAMSLALGALAAMAATCFGCAVWGRGHRIRGLGLSRWREIARFGASRTTTEIFKMMGDRSADIVIGRTLGMAAAGFYSRGFGLINMFRQNIISAVNRVAFPVFSQRHRHNEDTAGFFLKSLSCLTGIAWPFLLYAIFMAFPAIRLAFGPQWDASVPVLRWLALAAMLGTLIYQCDLYFTAIGRVNIATRSEAVFQSTRIAITIAAAFEGLEYVAASQVAVYAIAIMVYYPSLFSKGNLRLKGVLRALGPSALVTVFSGLGPAAVFVAYPPVAERLWLPLSAATATAAIGWLAGIYWVDHPLWQEIRPVLARLWPHRMFRTD